MTLPRKPKSPRHVAVTPDAGSQKELRAANNESGTSVAGDLRSVVDGDVHSVRPRRAGGMSGAMLLQSGSARQWRSTNQPGESGSDHKTDSNEVNSRARRSVVTTRRMNRRFLEVSPPPYSDRTHRRNNFFAFSKRILRSAALFGARRRIAAIVCEPEQAAPEPTRSSQSLPYRILLW